MNAAIYVAKRKLATHRPTCTLSLFIPTAALHFCTFGFRHSICEGMLTLGFQSGFDPDWSVRTECALILIRIKGALSQATFSG